MTMKKTSPRRKQLTLNPETVRALGVDRLDRVIGGASVSCGCSNNSCLHQVTGCKQN
jgi:hypothetical protein